MKLVKVKHNQIGPLVFLPDGAFAIDVIRSLGVLGQDALSNGLLNGAFKEGGEWSSIVKHWAYLRSPLKKLVRAAQSCPKHQNLVLQPLNRQVGATDSFDPIIAIEIQDIESLEELDPTGRRAMERQFMEPSEITASPSRERAETGQVIDFSFHKGDAARS